MNKNDFFTDFKWKIAGFSTHTPNLLASFSKDKERIRKLTLPFSLQDEKKSTQTLCVLVVFITMQAFSGGLTSIHWPAKEALFIEALLHWSNDLILNEYIIRQRRLKQSCLSYVF